MSGHSKWSTIKHGKAVSDARRGQLFTKLSKEIIIAARQGGADPEMNFRLRMAIQRAKDNNMPADTITRALKRGSGEGSDGEQMAEVVYEGYGPGGTAILLEALTDNKNRTASDVRSTFTRIGGNLAQSGAVSWQFKQRGVVVVEASPEKAEDLTLITIDAGAEDFETSEGHLQVYSEPKNLENIRRTLTDNGAQIKSFELSMVPQNTVVLEANHARQTLRLLDNLEELDDIQRVFSNADFPDEIISEYGKEE